MSGLLDEEIISELVEIMGDDIGLLFETFISDSEEKIVQLKSILENGNGDEIRRLAHSLKGSSKNIGAVNLAMRCENLEIDGREGNVVDVEKVYSAISVDYNAVKAELQMRFLN